MANEQATQAGGNVGLPKGAKVGKYEVVERIGMGGQAVVYKCHDHFLDRPVAVKQISTHLAGDEKFLERFRKEAQILARLGGEEEAIVTIHELIEDEKGLFIVMEFLSGPSLEAVLQDTDGPTQPKAVLQIIWRLAAALDAVHNAGIIHRDLKPSNIIICQGLRPKITDFGVAASISGQTSMLLGTTKYMAPELFEGERVDGRADMYSLGFIAYELLLGRPKFSEIFADVVRDKHSEALRWMKWHGNANVEAPLLTQVNPSVPAPLAQIVAKMMAKDIHERYENMEQLGRAIKMSFSPRAKGGGRGVRRHPPRPAAAATAATKPEKPAATTLDAEDSGAHLVPPDAGDELEVTEDTAATAPVPEARRGKKALKIAAIVLAALGFLGIVGAGVNHLLQQRQMREASARAADAAYKKAKGTLDEALKEEEREKFEAAAKGFQDVQTRYPSSSWAWKASVFHPLAEAYMASFDGDWEEAVASENQASEQLRRIQRSREDLVRWTRESMHYIHSHRRFYTATRKFREHMKRAREEFADKRYDEARIVANLLAKTEGLTAEHKEKIAEFLREVDLTEFREQVAQQRQIAADLAAQNEFLQAERAFQQIQELLQSDQAKILPDDEAAEVRQNVTERLKALTSTRTLSEAIAAVDKARAGGDKRSLLLALRSLQRIRPSDEVAAEIATIQAEDALNRGRQYKASGQIEEARKWFQKSIEFRDNKEARDELAMLSKAEERASLISAGDAHFASAQWADALKEYEKASQLSMDDSLAAKMVECRFRIKLSAADKLRADKDYDAAAKAYQEARASKPSSAALIDARLAAMAADRQYEKLMGEGRDALKREQWVKARDIFGEAKKIRSTPEVNDAVLETRYRENLSRGTEALQQGDYKGALGYFNLAKSFKDTEEVRGLIARAEQALKDDAG